jgi:hypothetical protein
MAEAARRVKVARRQAATRIARLQNSVRRRPCVTAYRSKRRGILKPLFVLMYSSFTLEKRMKFCVSTCSGTRMHYLLVEAYLENKRVCRKLRRVPFAANCLCPCLRHRSFGVLD